MAKSKAGLTETLEPHYEVGFCKPPKATQFKKGQSGNPNGRPKGIKNTATIARTILNEKIAINENGRQKIVTKREALIKQLVNRSLQGDVAFLKLVLSNILPAVDAAQSEAIMAETHALDDALILGPLLEQLHGLTTQVLEPPEPQDKKDSGDPSQEKREDL